MAAEEGANQDEASRGRGTGLVLVGLVQLKIPSGA
jgi:hypothetical protein